MIEKHVRLHGTGEDDGLRFFSHEHGYNITSGKSTPRFVHVISGEGTSGRCILE